MHLLRGSVATQAFTTSRQLSPTGASVKSWTEKVAPSYPSGTITTKSTRSGLWRIAVPKSAAKVALGNAADAFGGDFVEVTPTATKPAGAAEVTEKDFDRSIRPWYKSPVVWGAAGGVVVLGLLTVWILK